MISLAKSSFIASTSSFQEIYAFELSETVLVTHRICWGDIIRSFLFNHILAFSSLLLMTDGRGEMSGRLKTCFLLVIKVIELSCSRLFVGHEIGQFPPHFFVVSMDGGNS